MRETTVSERRYNTNRRNFSKYLTTSHRRSFELLPMAALGNSRQVNARFDVELVEYVTKVCVDGVRRNEESCSDFAVSLSVRSKLDDP
jgi:hypothetical protein